MDEILGDVAKEFYDLVINQIKNYQTAHSCTADLNYLATSLFIRGKLLDDLVEIKKEEIIKENKKKSELKRI